MNGARLEENDRVVGLVDEPEDEMGDMLCHEVKGTRDVHPQPSDLIATFISQHGELPEVIGSQQGYDKEKDVGVGFEWLEVFLDILHYIFVLA
jgi:hypothetical protein